MFIFYIYDHNLIVVELVRIELTTVSLQKRLACLGTFNPIKKPSLLWEGFKYFYILNIIHT